jgi:N-acetylglucosaminyldiphosphoundecaprenol N-acetyl-beta-D-mannosaminyltransferase
VLTEVRSAGLCGVRVDALSIADIERLIAQAVADARQIVIAHHNLHSVRLVTDDARMRAFYEQADWIHVDGMGIVAMARLLGLPLRPADRVTYVDLITPLLQAGQRCGWRVAFLGWRPEVVEQARAVLTERYPALEQFYHHGYFDLSPGSAEDAHVVDALNAFAPDVLLVGMGMPRQEHWILEHRPLLHARAILPAGACLDYVARVVPTPPRVLGRSGLEWLYRLIYEPRRLWRRYLVEPWFVAGLLVRELADQATRGRDRRGADDLVAAPMTTSAALSEAPATCPSDGSSASTALTSSPVDRPQDSGP